MLKKSFLKLQRSIQNNISIFDGLMIGRKIYDDPMFLRKIDKEIYNNEDVKHV
jgi:tRNA-dihydrouridine synthase